MFNLLHSAINILGSRRGRSSSVFFSIGGLFLIVRCRPHATELDRLVEFDSVRPIGQCERNLTVVYAGVKTVESRAHCRATIVHINDDCIAVSLLLFHEASKFWWRALATRLVYVGRMHSFFCVTLFLRDYTQKPFMHA